jgi:ferritin-like metal-binding protein YciE
MDKMKDLEDLLKHELKDIYSAESQLCDALPKMKSEASDSKLQTLFKDHLEETKEQKERLSKFMDEFGIAKDEKCLAMEGLINEGEHRMRERASSDVKDAALIGAAQRIEHYEIAAYGTAVSYARRLNLHELADALEKTLNEEKAADFKLNELATHDVNEEIA